MVGRGDGGPDPRKALHRCFGDCRSEFLFYRRISGAISKRHFVVIGTINKREQKFSINAFVKKGRVISSSPSLFASPLKKAPFLRNVKNQKTQNQKHESKRDNSPELTPVLRLK